MSSGGYGAASGGDVWDGDDELEYVVGDNVEDDGGGSGGRWWWWLTKRREDEHSFAVTVERGWQKAGDRPTADRTRFGAGRNGPGTPIRTAAAPATTLNSAIRGTYASFCAVHGSCLPAPAQQSLQSHLDFPAFITRRT